MDCNASEGGGLRLGIVPYLNVQPLIWKFRRTGHCTSGVALQAALPRLLAQELREGSHDAAIVPIIEFLQHPADYVIVPGMAIGCRGQVRSVVLYSNCALPDVSSVQLDPASLTSVNLLKILLAERQIDVRYINSDELPATTVTTARLLIGDPALRSEGQYRHAYDLGQLWHEQTGLPFVFAVWLAHPGAKYHRLAELLQEAARWGRENLETVAEECAGDFGVKAEFALDYFRNFISYSLGPEELQAIDHFRGLCVKHGMIQSTATPEEATTARNSLLL